MPTLTLAFKGKTLQVLPLEGASIAIGRDVGQDVQIDSLAVEPEHAKINFLDQQWHLLQGDHDNTTFVNHKPVQKHLLQNNDLIRVGKHTLLYRDDDIPVAEGFTLTGNEDIAPEQHISPQQPDVKSTSQATQSGLLQIMNGKNLGKTIKLQSGLTDLGQLGMSPALIALRSDGYFISNLTKDYTLSVGDHEIGDKSWPLHDGDMIKLNQLTLQFHLQA